MQSLAPAKDEAEPPRGMVLQAAGRRPRLVITNFGDSNYLPLFLTFLSS